MANFYRDNEDMKFHLEHPLMKKIVALKERNFEDKDKYDYAPLDFEDAMDSYDRTLEIVGEICGDIIGPNAEGVDQEGPQVVNDRVIYAKGTAENHEALTKAGLIGMSLPREYDGLNFPIVPYVMAAELVSRADGGFANIWGLQDCAETIHEFASKEQKAEYLPRFAKGATAAMDLTEPDAGSDLQAVQLKATYNKEEDQWYLNGVKRFITNGDGDVSLVLARSEEGTTDGRGLSMFIYDKKHMAVKVRRIEHKMGIIGSPTCELVFTNAPAELVGSRKMGLIKYVMSLMNGARLGVGAQSVGIAEAAYREGLAYAKERRQFGKAIIEFPAVYEMLTNMEAKLNASRSVLYETSRFVDVYKSYFHISQDRSLDKDERMDMKKYQKLADVFTPLLKLFASEFCNEIAYDSLQVHAGSGYMKDYPIERLVRDARITNIYEGTTQLQVVAAIRGVTTGAYLGQIKEYEASDLNPQYEYLRTTLKAMTAKYEEAVAKVNEINATADHNDFLDFHARRLVEMAGYIIMGYLLLTDTTRNDKYHASCEVFVKMGKAKVASYLEYIMSSELKDLGIFKK
ncbi:acyl-CoA dehydrogenase family protein [Marinifilum sp. D737]|uniref:acyl-CoA dehydrogenase family protein n=1 Tax=Marinifilum sp. D737 TaxID=2969628 RepID=UPI0022753CF8|nr:acyl-CoA dehydrogenase family protein [Marinifilum sp. D737]MCY1633342.1 acyl-CoA dehydrogenase family protein [Marinifilum sp. D737]